MNARTIGLVLVFLVLPAATWAAPKGGSARSPLHPVPEDPEAWVAVVLNDDTWAGDGIGLMGGAQWTVLPAAEPGVVTMGPALAISTQSRTLRDAPCSRKFRENIVHAGLDARYVLPVSRTVRPFVRTGPGLYHFETEYRDDDCREFDQDDSGLGWMLGFGLTVELAPSLRITGGIEAHAADDDWVAFSIGLGFPF